MSDVIQALARMLQEHMIDTPYVAYKAAGTPNPNAYLYQSGGLFGRCDGPSTLVNAMVGPVGMEAALTWVGTDTQRETVDALKAISETGSEQSAVCGDCVKIYLKACAQHYCFGRFCRQTDELLFDDLGLRAHGNVPVKALFGDITTADGTVLLRSGEQIDDAFMLQTRAVGYALRLKLSTMLWNGNPANSNRPAYVEFSGLQQIVNTGKYDSYTQLDCDSIDAFLMNFAYNNPQATGTYSIRNWFQRMVNQMMIRATRAGFAWETANMVVVMTPNAWDCVARAYACAGLDLCAGASTSRTVSADANQALTRHEEILSRMAVPIMGRWYPVILDSQIPETTGQANGICSDIYFLVTEVNGETVLYGQFQDFNMTYGQTRDELTSMFGSDDIAITDNGRFAVVRDNSRGCFDVQIYTKPRIVSVMPWLTGRIQNVCCDVLQEPFPDVTGSGRVYEKDGGRTITPVPTLYGC